MRRLHTRHFVTLVAIGWLLVVVNSNASAQDASCTPSDQLKFGASDGVTDNETDLLLLGRAWLCFRGNLLTAPDIRYDRRTQRGGAAGGVQLRDSSGNVTRAERLDFNAELNSALGQLRPGQ